MNPMTSDDRSENRERAEIEDDRRAELHLELQRLQAMEQSLLEWATQLEANRDNPGDVGKFIAMELRSRMAGR